MRLGVCLLLPVAMLSVLAGCVRQSTQGAEKVYSYELWVPLSILLLGMSAAPVGWLLRNSWKKSGWGLLAAGPLFALVVAPTWFLASGRVSDESISMRRGFWGLSRHEVRFDDLAELRLTKEVKRQGRRGARWTAYTLVCSRRDGSAIEIPLENPVSSQAVSDFVNRAMARGVPYRDDSHAGQ